MNEYTHFFFFSVQLADTLVKTVASLFVMNRVL